MKKLFLLLSCFSFLVAGAQPAVKKHTSSISTSSYQSGEWFRFRIHYGIFNASYATLSLNKTTLDNKPVYHAVGKGRTVGLARLFFKVDDVYQSYFDIENGDPYKFIRKIDEGGYTKDKEIYFDHNKNQALVIDNKNKKQTRLSIEQQVQDMMSSFYYLRDHYKVSELKPGYSVTINMFFDEDNYRFKLKYLGKEVVRTKFGKVDCLKFRPYVKSGRVFKEKESLTLWVSNDANRVPIRVKADLAVGSLKADLDAFKGLKHQFKIHKR